jgi:hypothetical protein
MTLTVLTDPQLDAVTGGLGLDGGSFSPMYLHLVDLAHFLPAFRQNTGIQIPAVAARGNFHIVSQSNGGQNTVGLMIA